MRLADDGACHRPWSTVSVGQAGRRLEFAPCHVCTGLCCVRLQLRTISLNSHRRKHRYCNRCRNCCCNRCSRLDGSPNHSPDRNRDSHQRATGSCVFPVRKADRRICQHNIVGQGTLCGRDRSLRSAGHSSASSTDRENNRHPDSPSPDTPHADVPHPGMPMAFHYCTMRSNYRSLRMRCNCSPSQLVEQYVRSAGPERVVMNRPARTA